MDAYEKGLDACREAANACAEIASGEHGSFGGEALVAEAARSESALRAAVRDLGVGERTALSPAVSACETLLVAIEDHEDDAAKALAEKIRAAEAALREVMGTPADSGPDDPSPTDPEHIGR